MAFASAHSMTPGVALLPMPESKVANMNSSALFYNMASHFSDYYYHQFSLVHLGNTHSRPTYINKIIVIPVQTLNQSFLLPYKYLTKFELMRYSSRAKLLMQIRRLIGCLWCQASKKHRSPCKLQVVDAFCFAMAPR